MIIVVIIIIMIFIFIIILLFTQHIRGVELGAAKKMFQMSLLNQLDKDLLLNLSRSPVPVYTLGKL